jgi:hypothetical protein
MKTETKQRDLESIGKSAMSAIAEMVAALECDYERLEELRDDREAYEGTGAEWAIENEEDAEELAELEAAAGDCTDYDDARQRIEEDPLSMEVRSGWRGLGEELQAEEFCLLLSTGGPAVRITGDVDEHGELSRPQLQVQDWFTPWANVCQDTAVLESYVACFNICY